MLLMCFALLGAVASRAVKVSGLLLIVSLLAMAIGVEGALHHRALASVVVDGVLMLLAVECSYVAALLLAGRGSWSLSS